MQRRAQPSMIRKLHHPNAASILGRSLWSETEQQVQGNYGDATAAPAYTDITKPRQGFRRPHNE